MMSTNSQHPITPPPELVKKWWVEAQEGSDFNGLRCWVTHVANRAAQWGADQELEACVEWVNDDLAYDVADRLRTARRPKPPNLKEQAQLAIDTAVADERLSAVVADVVRRALEALPDD
jgi:hypothetical protein